MSAAHDVERAQLVASYEQRLRAAEDGRKTLITSFMDEAAAERDQLLREQEAAVESAAASVIEEKDSVMHSAMAQLAEHWEAKYSAVIIAKDKDKQLAIDTLNKEVPSIIVFCQCHNTIVLMVRIYVCVLFPSTRKR